MIGTSRILQNRLRERLIVTLKSGTSFSGVLYSQDRKAITLRDSSALGAGERRTDLPLDGEVIVLLADVDFIQRP